MTNIIKFSQLSPYQQNLWEVVMGYPNASINDLITLLDSNKIAVKGAVTRLMSLGYLSRQLKDTKDKDQRRRSVYGYITIKEDRAIRFQEANGISKRKPRPCELARKAAKNLPPLPEPGPIITFPPEPVKLAPVTPVAIPNELAALRAWKAFAIQLYPQLNQADETFEARQILMRQYPNDAKHRQEIMTGKHDHGPAMQALIEVLARS